MTPKKYGYNSYCSLFGNHKGDPCACGWSTKNDFSEFGQDLVRYVELCKKEIGKTTLSLDELGEWVYKKIWS